MKLVTFSAKGQEHVGVLQNDKVVDLNVLLNRPHLHMLTLVEEGLDALLEQEQYIGQADASAMLDTKDVVLKAPLPRPKKVACIGLNYMDHCREQNVEPPKTPLLFSKWSSCVVGPHDDIVLPTESEQVDFEAELGVILQKGGKAIDENDALAHVFGYVIVNDVSARDVQFADKQWQRGKSFDTFAPTGPYLVTADEIPDPQQLSMTTTVNGDVLQDSNTNEMIFSVAHILSYLSNGFTFESGDLISTGTPHGVGVFRDPQIFLHDNDEVVIEIEKLGTLTNKCVPQ